MVEIGRTGKVFGTIKAETVVIKGVVEGDVVATSQGTIKLSIVKT